MKFSLVVVIFLALGGFAQNENCNLNDLHRNNNISIQNLKRNVYDLSDAKMEGRKAFTTGESKATNYIINEFSVTGLLPGVQQRWVQPIQRIWDSIVNAKLTIDSFEIIQNSKHFYFDISNESQNLSFNSLIIIRGGLTDQDYQKAEVEGKIALVLPELSKLKSSTQRLGENSYPPAYLRKMKEIASRHRLKAVIMIDDYWSNMGDDINLPRLYIPFKTRQKDSTSIQKSCGIFFISLELMQKICVMPYSEIVQQHNIGTLTVIELRKQIDVDFKKIGVPAGQQSGNILAHIEGTDKKMQYLFVTAHFDHRGMGLNHKGEIFYGADDNSSGVAALLEIARQFSRLAKNGCRPRRSIVFMAFAGEEEGMLGSHFYTDNPVYSLDSVTVVLNIDMVGRIGSNYQSDKDSSNYVYTIGIDSLSSKLKHLSDGVNSVFINMKLDETDNSSYFTRSDHFQFAKHGVPIIFYTNGEHLDYHKITDTPDKINFELLAKRTKLIFYTAWMAANSEEGIIRDKRLTTLKQKSGNNLQIGIK